jgi:hypothetical protein
MSPGYAGQTERDIETDSLINENASAIDFGVAVTRGAAVSPGQTGLCKPLATNGDIPIGITKRITTQTASTDGNNTVNYPQRQAVPVMKQGIIWAVPFENVVSGDGVIALPAQNGKLSGTTAGAANGTSRMAFSGAVWLETALAGVPARIRIGNFV